MITVESRCQICAKPKQRPFFRLVMQRFLSTYFPRVGRVVGCFVVVSSTLSTSVGLFALSWWLWHRLVATTGEDPWGSPGAATSQRNLPLVNVALSTLYGTALVEHSSCYFDGNNVFRSCRLVSFVLTDSGCRFI